MLRALCANTTYRTWHVLETRTQTVALITVAGMLHPKTIARLENTIWILLYGGLLTLVLGLFTQRADDALGLSLVVGGGAVAALGAVLVYVRSRVRSSDG
jgi:hypothetical protein